MKGRSKLYAFVLLILAGVGLTTAGDGIKPTYQPSDKAYYLTDAQASFVRPGLKLQIQKVEFEPPNVHVTFRISDNADQGLDRQGLQTPGSVSANFILARIKPDDSQYTAYTTRTRPSKITGLPILQATSDSGGTYTSVGDGVYRYTLGTKLPADFEANATHTVGMFAVRNLTDFGLTSYVANATLDFVPANAPVTQVRDVVRTEACNQCHNPLGAHTGGARQVTQLCILCHQPQSIDDTTENPIDFKVMIHKIHMGANLPSVSGRRLNILGTSGSGTGTTATGSTQAPIPHGAKIAGKPYIIEDADFSTVVWPQDVRNCTTCHQGGQQSDNWKTNPNRAACGSCHDNLNFATGENHPGGVQVDDSKCSICHPADTGLEFDLSVTGAHTIPIKSKKLAGLNLTITGVTNTKPGEKPAVSFTVTDSKQNPVDATKLNSLGFLLAGPTDDYSFVTRSASGLPGTENALTAAKPSGSGYTYTFATAIPADAKGSFTIGGQAYRLVTIAGPLAGQSFSIREGSNNPLFYFSVGGDAVKARRKVVDVKNCNSCHERLALHGGTRTNATEYCQMCHNAKAQTPEGQTISFRTHIHRIHTGEELENEWEVGRNYNGVRFPGDRRDCAKCHVNNSNQLPVPAGLAWADTPLLFYTPTGPTASACLGCHDGMAAAAHAYLMTAPFGESCAVCHGESADFAVSKVHAR
ncbi:MAG: OmcA/MtrC family decaheme c-type cytochrome [Acidobacteria bacterium]|nr:OmcA/MtrC family decaheme c-type cytochrome [Acidobacteriota bacterium]